MRAEVVASVCAENAGLRVRETPVCSQIQNLAYEEVSVLFRYFYTSLAEESFREREVTRPLSLGPVKLPPMMGMALRIPRGPWDS
jgi:hypothetical protein